MTTRPPVLVIGDIVTDILAVHSGQLAVGSDTAADISVTGGGSAANTAAWLAFVDCPVSLVAVTGTDHAGDQRLAELRAAGVDCAAVRRAPEAPTGTVIVLAHAAERSMLNDRGANLLLAPSDIDRAMAGTVAHVHVSGYALLDEQSRPAGRHALAVARARGVSTSVDAASAAPLSRLARGAFLDWVRDVDILFANLDEALVLRERPAGSGADPAELAGALANSVRHAVVKLGGRGAVWAGPDGALAHVPATVADVVVDPTGAGDAFAAGFLAAWLADGDARAALSAGARTGALAVTAAGGRPDSQAGSNVRLRLAAQARRGPSPAG